MGRQIRADGKLHHQTVGDLATEGAVNESQPELYQADRVFCHGSALRGDSCPEPVRIGSLRLGLGQRWAFCHDLARPNTAKNRDLAIDNGFGPQPRLGAGFAVAS